MDLGNNIYIAFQGLGLAGMLLALYLLFVIDCTAFPVLPEFFALTFFIAGAESMTGGDIWLWGALVLSVCVSGSVTGNAIMYNAVKRMRVPGFVKKVMRRYANTLFVKDERIILVNRIAPVLPFQGAFIAVCNWPYRRSMAYIALGGAIKYAVLLSLAGTFLYLFETGVTRKATIVLVIAVVAFSIAASQVQRKRIAARVA